MTQIRPRECKAGRLAYGGRAKRNALLTLLMAALPVFAEPVPVALNGPVSQDSAPSAFVTVNHLGESDQQTALREGQLLSRRRSTDPFGIAIRGPFKGLPPVVEHSTATPAQPDAAIPTAAAVIVPTLEKAVQELSIGGVNVGAHEILIGSRSIREGDLLLLESGGRQFAVWVQSVGVGGVSFYDIDLQKQFLKPFGSAPKELPGDSAGGNRNIRNFLNRDAKQ